MKKLSLDELMAKSNDVASEELMSQISGGTENSCHPCDWCPTGPVHEPDNTSTGTGNGGF
jgi:hypothetical protein